MTVLRKTNNGQIFLVSQTSVFCLTSTMMRLYCLPVILFSVLVLILNERTHPNSLTLCIEDPQEIDISHSMNHGSLYDYIIILVLRHV